MVKKIKFGGGKRYKGSAAPSAETPSAPNNGGPAPPKHIKRKIARKVGFLEKVAATSTTRKSGVQKVKKKKGRAALSAGQALDSLGASLAGVLSDVERGGGKGAKAARGQGTKSNRGRCLIALKETERMQQVLSHPVFKANPFTAITQHLQNTLPPAPSSIPGPKKKPSHTQAAASQGSVLTSSEAKPPSSFSSTKMLKALSSGQEKYPDASAAGKNAPLFKSRGQAGGDRRVLKKRSGGVLAGRQVPKGRQSVQVPTKASGVLKRKGGVTVRKEGASQGKLLVKRSGTKRGGK